MIIWGENLSELKKLETDSVDLVFTSPPYEAARTYDISFDKSGEEWVEWAFVRFQECLRVSRGLVAWVVEGQTKDFDYSATKGAYLMADCPSKDWDRYVDEQDREAEELSVFVRKNKSEIVQITAVLLHSSISARANVRETVKNAISIMREIDSYSGEEYGGEE